MPWRRPNNAAIGLASLKAAALGAGAKACDVLYLNDRWFRFLFDHGKFSDELRQARYSEFARVISELAGVIQAGEWMFSASVFESSQCTPDAYRSIFNKAAGGNEYGRFADDFVAFSGLAEGFLQQCIDETDWSQYDVIGLSCVFYQLLPSVALAKKLRGAGFKGKLVLGGPLCEGIVGKQLLEVFPFLDAVFDGESEVSFPAYLFNLAEPLSAPAAPGVWQRDREGGVFRPEGSSAVGEMDSLPVPAYEDFFGELDRQGLVTRQEVAFPLEASRGCWWGQHHHCIFCGLNGSDMTYRAKSPDRIYAELVDLHTNYGVGHFAFTDNIVSPKFMRPLMERLASKPLPVTFHAEIKANLSRLQIKEYRRAGFIYLQPGIESLSSHVLEVMDKGISALANVACLKFCREAGITPFWNLLHSFPGETAADYEQTLQFLRAIVHLHPPEAVTAMRLTRFSPSFDRSVALGFHDKRPAQFYRLMYPFDEAILSNLVNSFEFSFHDDLDRDSLLEPIEAFIADWKNQTQMGTLVLDGTVLYDSRFNRVNERRKLDALEVSLYEFCDTPRAFADILVAAEERVPGIARTQVCETLQSFVRHRTMVCEDDAFLSLAVHDSEFIPWQAIAVVDQINLPREQQEVTPA
jgi:ribosomal peptide maturation radical SAM protein 1